MELSPRQREILEFVNTHVDEQGYPPTVREIGQAVGLTSPSTVHAHLARLESSGLIRRDPTKPRALEVIEGGRSRDRAPAAVAAAPHSNVLPLLGDVAAGTGLVADEAVEDMVAVPDQLCSDADFLLTVKGDSMIEAGILDGDTLVVQEAQDASNGDVVVALVGDDETADEATVKTFYRENGRIRLQPENSALEPIYADYVEVIGKVVGVFRSLR